jgi:hypothetical protein
MTLEGMSGTIFAKLGLEDDPDVNRRVLAVLLNPSSALCQRQAFSYGSPRPDRRSRPIPGMILFGGEGGRTARAGPRTSAWRLDRAHPTSVLPGREDP